MVVADDHALTSIFAAHHIWRDRFRYDACVGEREVFGDDAPPAVSAKFNRTHASEYTRGSTGRNSRIGLLKGSDVGRNSLRSEQTHHFLLFQPFHNLADVLCSIARTNQQRIGSFDHHQVFDSDGRDELSGAVDEIPAGVDRVAMA